MKHRASLFLIAIGIVCLLLFRRLKGVKEGFIVCSVGSYPTQSCGTQRTCIPQTYPLGGVAPPLCTNAYVCNDVCASCLAGSYCTGLASVKCIAGTYQDLRGQSSCKTCTSGNYCPENVATQTACPTGSTSPAGSSNISQCICNPGTYLNGTICTQCQAGNSCINGVKTPCVAGSTFAGVGASNCTACPTGSVCTKTGFTCQAGYQSAGTATTATCIACLTGQTSTAGGTCSNCPSNTYSGISGQTTCSNCPVGTYSGIAASQCTSCPPNTISCTSATSLVCQPGYSNTGTACVNCPTGYSCTGYSNTQCLAGTYSGGTQAACSNCSTGFYSAAGASSCSACIANSVSCTSATSYTCASNYYSNAGVCSQCPPNSTCAPGGSSGALTGVTALTCSPGYSNGGSNNCVRIKYGSMLPYYTQGTIDQMNNSLSVVNSVGCDSNPNTNTCQYTWYTSPGVSNVGPSSTNPCPARNSWYDFSKQNCVDGLGNEVLIMNPCASNTVYSLRDNACVSVRKPFASQPPNTVGSPSLSSPGDFGNCKTSDGGDCTPYFNNNGTMTQTNPCGTSSNYSFPARGCIAKPSLSPCCGVPASNLVSMPDCSNLVSIKAANTKSSIKCATGATNICCGASMANNATCINGGYWIRSSNVTYNPSYNTLCGIAGFDDYTNNLDTMAAVS